MNSDLAERKRRLGQHEWRAMVDERAMRLAARPLTPEQREQAFSLGKVYGAFYGGDVYKLVRAENAVVKFVSPAEILRLAIEPPAPGRHLYGLIRLPDDGEVGGRPEIFIDRSLPASERLLTLAHELAHCIYQSPHPQDYYESWAEGFMSSRKAPKPPRREALPKPTRGTSAATKHGDTASLGQQGRSTSYPSSFVQSESHDLPQIGRGVMTLEEVEHSM